MVDERYYGAENHLSVCLYGLRFTIAAEDSRTLTALVAMLPPGSAEISTCASPDRSYCVVNPAMSPGPTGFELQVNGEVVRRCATLSEAARVFEADVQIWVAEMAKARVFVHAGVVGWRGRAIVIPGSSYSGKTTLVASLVKAGATYYSDEYAVLDRSGHVHPFPRPLAVRRDRARLRITCEELGGRAGTDRLRAGLVVVTTYRKGAEWRPQAVAAGRAVLALAANSVSIRRQPGFVLSTLSRLVDDAMVIESDRPQADEICFDLLSRLTQRALEEPPPLSVPLPDNRFAKEGECYVT